MDNDLILASAVDGIDVIVGRHSYNKLDEPVVITLDEAWKEKAPTVIVQAYQYINFLGKVDIEFDENSVIVAAAGQLIDVMEKAEVA